MPAMSCRLGVGVACGFVLLVAASVAWAGRTQVAVPWVAPVALAQPAVGWNVGSSGTVATSVMGRPTPTSTAWAANVRYRDRAVSDPPSRTLARIPRRGVVVWVSIQPPLMWPPDGRRTSGHFSLGDAYRFQCCDGSDALVPEWELYGWGPRHTYSVLARIYFGSTPTRTMKAQAQHALDGLRLPAAA
jgi:hypothetical protein